MANNPLAPSTNMATKASEKSPVDTPFRYSTRIRLSMLGTRLIYRGNILMLNFLASSFFMICLSSTLGCLIFSGPIPVMNSLSGMYPLRTTACRSSSFRESAGVISNALPLPFLKLAAIVAEFLLLQSVQVQTNCFLLDYDQCFVYNLSRVYTSFGNLFLRSLPKGILFFNLIHNIILYLHFLNYYPNNFIDTLSE